MEEGDWDELDFSLEAFPYEGMEDPGHSSRGGRREKQRPWCRWVVSRVGFFPPKGRPGKAQLAGVLPGDVLAYVHSSPGYCTEAGLMGGARLNRELSRLSTWARKRARPRARQIQFVEWTQPWKLEFRRQVNSEAIAVLEGVNGVGVGRDADGAGSSQAGPTLPEKKLRRPLTQQASLVFIVFRETRWAEDGGRMYAVRVLEESEDEEEASEEEERSFEGDRAFDEGDNAGRRGRAGREGTGIANDDNDDDYEERGEKSGKNKPRREKDGERTRAIRRMKRVGGSGGVDGGGGNIDPDADTNAICNPNPDAGGALSKTKVSNAEPPRRPKKETLTGRMTELIRTPSFLSWVQELRRWSILAKGPVTWLGAEESPFSSAAMDGAKSASSLGREGGKAEGVEWGGGDAAGRDCFRFSACFRDLEDRGRVLVPHHPRVTILRGVGDKGLSIDTSGQLEEEQQVAIPAFPADLDGDDGYGGRRGKALRLAVTDAASRLLPGWTYRNSIDEGSGGGSNITASATETELKAAQGQGQGRYEQATTTSASKEEQQQEAEEQITKPSKNEEQRQRQRQETPTPSKIEPHQQQQQQQQQDQQQNPHQQHQQATAGAQGAEDSPLSFSSAVNRLLRSVPVPPLAGAVVAAAGVGAGAGAAASTPTDLLLHPIIPDFVQRRWEIELAKFDRVTREKMRKRGAGRHDRDGKWGSGDGGGDDSGVDGGDSGGACGGGSGGHQENVEGKARNGKGGGAAGKEEEVKRILRRCNVCGLRLGSMCECAAGPTETERKFWRQQVAVSLAKPLSIPLGPRSPKRGSFRDRPYKRGIAEDRPMHIAPVASAKAEGASELYGALDESALVAVGVLVEEMMEELISPLVDGRTKGSALLLLQNQVIATPESVWDGMPGVVKSCDDFVGVEGDMAASGTVTFLRPMRCKAPLVRGHTRQAEDQYK
eukprot:jgi/Undpi1/4610/HiC_scaffold_18.g07964.m1